MQARNNANEFSGRQISLYRDLDVINQPVLSSKDYTIYDHHAITASKTSLFSPRLSRWLFTRTTVSAISCCSIGVFRASSIYPTGRSSALEIDNGLWNNLLCTQTGRTSSYASTLLVLSCWTSQPTFPYSRLPSWTTATQLRLFIINLSMPTITLSCKNDLLLTLNLRLSNSDMMNFVMSDDKM